MIKKRLFQTMPFVLLTIVSLNGRSASEIALELLAQQQESLMLTTGVDGVLTAGTIIAATPDDETTLLPLWNTKGQALGVLEHEAPIIHASFNKDGTKMVVTLENDTAVVWDCTTRNQLITFNDLKAGENALHTHGSLARNPIFNDASDRVAIVLATGAIKIFNADTGLLITTIRHANVNHIEFNSMRNIIVSASDDHTAKIWNVNNGVLLTTLSHDNAVNTACFNSAGDKVVTASQDGTAKVWNVANGNLLHTLSHETDVVNSAVFDPSGQKIITASNDGTAKIWSALTGNVFHTLNYDIQETDEFQQDDMQQDDMQQPYSLGMESDDDSDGSDEESMQDVEDEDRTVMTAVFNQTGELALTSSVDGTARVWDVSTGRLLALFNEGDPLVSALMSTSDDAIITLSENGTANLWRSLPPLLIGHYFNNENLSLDQKNILVSLHESRIKLNAANKSLFNRILLKMPSYVARALEVYYE